MPDSVTSIIAVLFAYPLLDLMILDGIDLVCMIICLGLFQP